MSDSERTVAVVILTSRPHSPPYQTPRVTVHESVELAEEWVESRPDAISRKRDGYEIHERKLHTESNHD